MSQHLTVISEQYFMVYRRQEGREMNDDDNLNKRGDAIDVDVNFLFARSFQIQSANFLKPLGQLLIYIL